MIPHFGSAENAIAHLCAAIAPLCIAKLKSAHCRDILTTWERSPPSKEAVDETSSLCPGISEKIENVEERAFEVWDKCQECENAFATKSRRYEIH